ncbi:MAG: CoA transferase, partial [Pseudomonadota bacterium]|nr:CoA transferase [Pseudomonadota bacterium]
MGQGPLNGLRIIEFVGIGPGPYASMLLTDMGAEVLSIHRKGAEKSAIPDIASRGRKSITLDVKTPEGHAVMMRLVAEADGLIEGFRPGVMERLGLGPDD